MGRGVASSRRQGGRSLSSLPLNGARTRTIRRVRSVISICIVSLGTTIRHTWVIRSSMLLVGMHTEVVSGLTTVDLALHLVRWTTNRTRLNVTRAEGGSTRSVSIRVHAVRLLVTESRRSRVLVRCSRRAWCSR